MLSGCQRLMARPHKVLCALGGAGERLVMGSDGGLTRYTCANGQPSI